MYLMVEHVHASLNTKKISSNPCCVFKAMDVLFVNLWQSMVTQKLYDLCTNYWSVNNQNDGKYNIKVLKKNSSFKSVLDDRNESFIV